jgi:hypothetical protein
MSTGIEKFRAIETFRLCWLKHRGNVIAACEELGWPIEIGRQYAAKISKKVDRDVSYGVSQSIMMQLVIGWESRVRHLYDMLSSLKEAEKQIVSCCCSFPVEPFKIRRKQRYKCILCGQECKIKNVGVPKVFDVQYRTLSMLQEEDRAIVEFAKKMGFVNPDAPHPSFVRNQVLVVNAKEKKGIEQEEPFVQNVDRLPPMEREKLRKSIENYIKQGEPEDGSS